MGEARRTVDELYCEIPLYGYEGAFYRLKRIDKPVLEKTGETNRKNVSENRFRKRKDS